jgi:hypothetical protein
MFLLYHYLYIKVWAYCLSIFICKHGRIVFHTPFSKIVRILLNISGTLQRVLAQGVKYIVKPSARACARFHYTLLPPPRACARCQVYSETFSEGWRKVSLYTATFNEALRKVSSISGYLQRGLVQGFTNKYYLQRGFENTCYYVQTSQKRFNDFGFLNYNKNKHMYSLIKLFQ